MRDFVFTIGGMMAMAGFFAADNIISHVICWLFYSLDGYLFSI